MGSDVDLEWVSELIGRNRYLVLATTDGNEPWVAPVEYLADEDLNLYFFSTQDSRHIRHIEASGAAAVAVFDREQPEYRSDASVSLNGVQMECSVTQLSEDEYTDDLRAGVEALNPPMPPYQAFKITPRRVYVPRIEDGVNVRDEVPMNSGTP